ncbi:type II secretion system protein [Sphingomonas sp.]|uniref:type II secretion system protein n=1 Tax=Sphingomonas sp. TaxID=28214 RepID=UPI0025E2C117|nr:type II secretion system protein [Sphingomonas sp.]
MKHGAAFREQGYGLVEALLAMAIIAVMMSALFSSISNNAKATRAVADRRAAVLIAKSALDLAIGGGAEGPRSGDAGRFRWQIAIDPYRGESAGAPRLDRVTVTIDQPGSPVPLFQLRSLRIGQ